MYGYIDGVNFIEEPAEKYWSFPKNYKGDKKKETKYMFMSGEYLCSEKKDGHYSRLIKDEDGNIILQGRTKSVSGEYLDKHEWCPQLNNFFDKLPNGTCLLGELYFPNQPGSRKVTTILGCLKNKAIERQEKNEKLHYYVFDVWAYNGKSLLNTTIDERVEIYLNKQLTDFIKTEEYVDKAEYYTGEEAWNELGIILSRNGEGMVITKKGTVPSPGKRTARKTLKVKQEINETIDAFLDGDYKPATKSYNGKEIEHWNYWINDKTGERSNICKFKEYSSGEPWEPVTKAYYNGWASAVSFSVMKDSKPERIAWISGITDSLKQDIVEKNSELIGKVAELTAMQIEHINGEYSLRHGKIVSWREDKTAEECSFTQISDN